MRPAVTTCALISTFKYLTCEPSESAPAVFIVCPKKHRVTVKHFHQPRKVKTNEIRFAFWIQEAVLVLLTNGI